MRSLDMLALSSNEKKEQRQLQLQKDFNDGVFITIKGASKKYGLSEATIRKYCKELDIPLIDTNGKPIVPSTDKNYPKWLLSNRVVHLHD